MKTQADSVSVGAWLPIESAPKDGRPIDLWVVFPDGGRRWPDASWQEQHNCTGPANWTTRDGWPLHGLLEKPVATHWMAPPKAPTSMASLSEGGAERPWQPWERNFPGGRVGVQEQQGRNENFMILHVESGGAKTTTSLRLRDAWDLALMISPEVKARLDELLAKTRKAEAAVWSMTNRECDTALLRRIADEHDCGDSCDYASSGNAAPCPALDRDGCKAAEADQMRELADAIDLGTSLKPPASINEAARELLLKACGKAHEAGLGAYVYTLDALSAVKAALSRFTSEVERERDSDRRARWIWQEKFFAAMRMLRSIAEFEPKDCDPTIPDDPYIKIARHSRTVARQGVERLKPNEPAKIAIAAEAEGRRLREAAQHLLDVGEFCRTDDTESALRGLRAALQPQPADRGEGKP